MAAGEDWSVNEVEAAVAAYFDMLRLELAGTYGKHQPFIVSVNEVEFSNDFSDTFHLYRLFHFGSAERIFTLKGSLRDTCNLEPVKFRAPR